MASKKKSVQPTPSGDFDSLVSSIVHLHRQTQDFATKAVNVALTLRNWLIGRQIEVYERNGEDRASYGDKLMDTLSKRLVKQGWERCERRELYRFRQFYLTYPKIVESLTPQSALPSELLPLLSLLSPSPSPIRASLTPESQTVESATPQLIDRLSFTHLNELIQLPDETQRRFYEIECIRGNWSVRELKRQIASLYYERSGLSNDKAALSSLANEAAEVALPAHIIRDPYVFEFLGLRSRDVMAESDLEDALLDRLQDFLLELGHGFCFEARQKRILIGHEYFFVDLVFYHRVLKCHILVELKTDAFRHEHLGQLNTYVAYFKKHQMTPGDQPPIGILLCSRKNDALVEFALGDLRNGAPFKASDFCQAGEGLPVVKIAELKSGLTDGTKWSPKELEPDQVIDTGDLLYSWSGSPDTSLDAFLWSKGPGLVNQHIFKVITSSDAEKRFVYYLLKHLRPVLVETARDKQTTGLEVLAAFDRLIAPIFDQAFANNVESQTLANLRETLLPRLLDGSVAAKPQ